MPTYHGPRGYADLQNLVTVTAASVAIGKKNPLSAVFIYMHNKLILPFLIISLLLILIGGGTLLAQEVCFKEACFEVELAETPKQRVQGLMHRESLASNKGMLFAYNTEGYYGFYMKNTLIPLDIIWLDKDKKIVHMSKNTQPCKVENCPVIYPLKPAQSVLEVNAGIAESIGLKQGDLAEFNRP